MRTDIMRAVDAAGVVDPHRVYASIITHVIETGDIGGGLASLRKHQPQLFRPQRIFNDAPKPSRASKTRGKTTRRNLAWDD